MVSMVSSLALLIVLVVPAVATGTPYIPLASLTCANLVDYKCRTGSCSKNPGVIDTWAVPKISDIEDACSACDYGVCLKTGFGTVSNGSDYMWWILVATSPGDCCAKCKAFPTGAATKLSWTPSCAWYQYRTLVGAPDGNNGVRTSGGYCYLYLTNPSGKYINPTCATYQISGVKYLASVDYTTTVGAGTACDKVINDPHFVGHHGARFDFNGMPGQTFCLITDANLHVNMKLTGYLDSRMENAVKVVDGKAVRTWMRELGFIWKVRGKEHSLLLATRAGPEIERGSGYMALVKADGVELPRLQVKDQRSLGGGLILRFIEVEHEGPFTVEFYNVVIDGVLDMDLRVRVANSKLRTADDAEAHFSFGLNKLQTTASVHGVLGQTYRSDRGERNQDFAAQLRSFATFSADSESGKGFLDGTINDYTASAILSPDCKYSTYNGRIMRTSAE
eukprot:TRINITY_DN415_c0_g1_i1.p1 TRINITY_DN415_c0_g1~~TRINITY_DN415_c0_g1_i1.p1  ORF type:complete len:449 (-),score=17.49 TRINITY_DN415_c0_g1_i1:870-2216(-)